VIDLLAAHAPVARRILDYGCGPAPVLVDMLQEAGYLAAGYDPLFPAGPVPEPPWDAIVSTETFEHLAAPADDLDRIDGWLAPGGCLVVVTRWHAGLETLADWWYARDRTHVAFYSRVTLDHLCRRRGWQLLQVAGPDLAVLRKGD
jgi:hypothetical protein